MEILMLSAATVAGGYILLRRILPAKLIVKFRVMLDIAFTAILLSIFGGTLMGALVATVSGLMFSVVLGVQKMLTFPPNPTIDQQRK